jgi:hypothetical protein
MRFLVGPLALLLLLSPFAQVQAAAFDPAPWLEDLGQVRQAFAQKYANWDWAVFERQANMARLFSDTEARIGAAQSPSEARDAIDKMIQSLGDGHVVINWTAPSIDTRADQRRSSPMTNAAAFCGGLGYDLARSGTPIAATVPGYSALPEASAPEFPAGIVKVGDRKVGFIRIGEFSPKTAPLLCEDAVRDASLAITRPCNDVCSDQIENSVYSRMSADLAARLHELKAVGASVLVIDITRNGGGSEWAEAAARMVTSRPVLSEQVGFVRDDHWVQKWGKLADELRKYQETASTEDRRRLRLLVAQADQARAQAGTPCASDAFFRGDHPKCAWLGHAGYATGLIRDAPTTEFTGKPWGPLVFSPAAYQYERGAWRGPVAVLVDGETWSAAEEFAAALQDSGSAVVAGAPSGGAGCGHTGDPPTILRNSKGTLQLPDCARFRPNGDNEVLGITPDILIAFRTYDGARRRGVRLAEKLPAIVEAAVSAK